LLTPIGLGAIGPSSIGPSSIRPISIRHVEVRDLAAGVHPGVGPAGHSQFRRLRQPQKQAQRSG